MSLIGDSENLPITREEVRSIRDYCMTQWERAICPDQKDDWNNQALAWACYLERSNQIGY
jgi:hypothetical protein